MWHHLHLHIFKYKTPTVSDLWPDQQRLLFVALWQLHTEGQLATELCTLCRLITKHLFHQPNASDIPSNVAVWLFIIWLALETDTCTNQIHLYPVYPHSSTFLKFIKKIKLNLNPHSNLPAAPAKASVQCGSIHDDGVFNVISAVTWGDTSAINHEESGRQRNAMVIMGAAEMLMTATEAFCPAPKWWKFTRFLSRTDMIWSWTIWLRSSD